MYKKNAKNNTNSNMKISNQNGGGGQAMDLQSLTAQDIQALNDQGITPEQIAQIAIEQGQPVPPLVLSMIQEEPSQGQPQDMQQMQEVPPAPSTGPSKTSKFPAMMDASTYNKYRKVDKLERKNKIGAHEPNVFGYVFSDLISEEILHEMKRTQGSFFVGVNLANLFNGFQDRLVNDEKSNQPKKPLGEKDSDKIFKNVGEWIDVDFNKIKEQKMGFRGSDITLLPENKLTKYSTFYEIIDESKKYATTSGFDTKITPYGLLTMTRMLFKYRKSNAQWFRVATILELIYKYLGVGQNREGFFNTKYEIPIYSLMDLEEFYNTDHIFMTEKELSKFKKDLNFYKYDTKLDIGLKLKEIKKNIKQPAI
jgi:hypothetical protein